MSQEAVRLATTERLTALHVCVDALSKLDDEERVIVVEALCSFYHLNPSPRLSDILEAVLEIVEAIGEKLPQGLFDTLKGMGVGGQPTDPKSLDLEAIRRKFKREVSGLADPTPPADQGDRDA